MEKAQVLEMLRKKKERRKEEVRLKQLAEREGEETKTMVTQTELPESDGLDGLPSAPASSDGVPASPIVDAETAEKLMATQEELEAFYSPPIAEAAVDKSTTKMMKELDEQILGATLPLSPEPEPVILQTFAPATPGTKLSAEMTVLRRWERCGELISESSDRQEMKVGTFVTAPANVHLGLGNTVNMGDFNSAKISVDISVPCYTEEVHEAFEFARTFVNQKLAEEMAELKGESDA